MSTRREAIAGVLIGTAVGDALGLPMEGASGGFSRLTNFFMSENRQIKISKFLSLVLRHEPEKVGLKLDPEGWVEVEALLAGCRERGKAMSREELDEMVATNPKKRFAFSEDGRRIRASQGHSVEVDLGYAPAIPPKQLFHGTATRFLTSIRAEGLKRGERHHVHLSADRETALKVGQRHGKPVLLVIDAEAMQAAGHAFYRSDNGVWLAEQVPVEFLAFPEENVR
jgi:putative RNA 2'-phosphotransferase